VSLVRRGGGGGGGGAFAPLFLVFSLPLLLLDPSWNLTFF
jgi:hypothetical protein